MSEINCSRCGKNLIGHAKFCVKCANDFEESPLEKAAPDLLEALNHIADECFDAMEGAGLPEFQFYEHWHTIAKAAIAKAHKK